MIKKFDPPVYMTQEEVEERFYPHWVVLANCTVEQFYPVGGYVMAVTTQGEEDYDEFLDYFYELSRDSEKYGYVSLEATKMPYDASHYLGAGAYFCEKDDKPYERGGPLDAILIFDDTPGA
ncbi:MAG: hypothetical protein LBE35_01020 [Clostridiales bacterium]|jgi:hypothetical protein|nr:hypothetical protein [Clostridiales bacterium]